MRSTILLMRMMVLASLAVAGCATVPTYVTPPLAEGAGAVIYGARSHQPRPPVALIDAIDTLAVPDRHRADDLVVAPGVRVLKVSGSCFRGWLMDIADAELRVTVEAGRRYEVQVAPAEGGMEFRIHDVASGRVVASQVATVDRTIFKKS
ncbi:MAG: hypothetical protein KA224_05760 [Steroidobacteraceae bacterium]|nr:hypothetical protein [Steroidobacteraceae bacterium]